MCIEQRFPDPLGTAERDRVHVFREDAAAVVRHCAFAI